MDTRHASGILLAVGIADLGLLDMVLAPRLAAELAAHAAVVAAPEPPREEKASAPAPQGAALPTATSASVSPAATPARPPEGAVVLFGLESTRIAGDDGELDRIARALASDPSRRILLRGHTDRLGARAYNLALGRRRAEAVAHWLAERGAPRDRIAIESVGAAEPADPQDGPSGWAKNRRVQILWR